MTAIQHPELDALLHLASGQTEPDTARHLEDCTSCQRRVVELRGVLLAARDELLEERPFCPSSDELAAHGSDSPHPHLATCPLCREEVRMRETLDRQPTGAPGLGLELAGQEIPAPAPWMSPTEAAYTGVAYLDAGVGDRLSLEQGQRWQSRVGDVSVLLECTGETLRTVIEGGEVVLVLGDEHLEKRLPLAAGEHSVEVGAWRWARIEAREDAGIP